MKKRQFGWYNPHVGYKCLQLRTRRYPDCKWRPGIRSRRNRTRNWRRPWNMFHCACMGSEIWFISCIQVRTEFTSENCTLSSITQRSTIVQSSPKRPFWQSHSNWSEPSSSREHLFPAPHGFSKHAVFTSHVRPTIPFSQDSINLEIMFYFETRGERQNGAM